MIRYFILTSLLIIISYSARVQTPSGRIRMNTSYTIDYWLEETLINGQIQILYRFVKNGKAENNQLVNIPLVIFKSGQNTRHPFSFTLEIPKGSDRIEIVRKLNLGEQPLNGIEDTEVFPKIVSLPSIDEFSPVIESKENYILEGETILLNLNKKQKFEEIEWVWTNSKQGEQIQVKADKGLNKYSVYGRYKGTSFRTQAKYISFEGKKASDIIDFDIVGPKLPQDDTLSMVLSLNILQNKLGDKLRWNWFNEAGNAIANEGNKCILRAEPILKNNIIKVCPITDNRIFGCKTFQLPINQLSGPSPFDIKYPDKLYTDQQITIKAVSIVKNEHTEWNWSINGKKLKTKNDSIQINPSPAMEIKAYPILNKRGGLALEKKLVLRNVVVRTFLPESIKGVTKFCGIPDKPQWYEIQGGILGTGSTQWLVYQNNKVIAKFSGSKFSFIPTVSSSYIISPENRPELKFNFNVDVIKIPDNRFTIDAPNIVCRGQPFTAILNSTQSDTNFKWKWYRNSANMPIKNIYMGSNLTITDSINQSTEYYVNLEYKSCPITTVIKKFVASYSKPFIPTTSYTYLKNTTENVKLEVQIPEMDAKRWEWSIDNFKTIISDTNVISNYKLKNGDNEFFVRYFDRCGYISPVASFSVIGEKYNYFFFNAGINIYNSKFNNAFNLSLGKKHWYFRGKGSLASILTNDYSTELFGKKLQISDQSRVLNFPSNTGSYYVVNGNQAVSRKSLTTGFMLGTNTIRFYAGAGFGESAVLWGINLHDYATGNFIRESWATNLEQSASGLEIEAGIFLKIGKFNLMPGVSVINDSKLKQPYVEINFGLGFSNK